MPEHVFAAAEWLAAVEHADQRRFAGAVCAHQSNAVSAFDHEADVSQDLFFSVALGYLLELGNDASAGLWLGEAEVNGLFFRRDLDALDALKFLDATLHL